MQHLWKNVSFVLMGMLVSALVTGVVVSLPRSLQSDAYAQDQRLGGGLSPQNLASAQALSAAFHSAAETLRPSVVSISTRTSLTTVPDSFRGRGFPFEEVMPRRREANGQGSGVIVHPDGYILTNNHVVEDADELTVELFDGRKVQGRIVGTDPPTDLAVVKIDVPGIRAARFGSSDAILVGDWVLAIGSPFGLDQTVTAGIISGKNRVQEIIDDGNGFEDFLQTDAAINPGNSGGALVNLRGELIGINTAILSRSGASAGIGFAIPESMAQPVLRAIIETGEVRRGFLGAQVVDVTPQTVDDFQLAVNSGALIGGVLEDQPAALAGLQPGDVVTGLDGREVRSGTQLRNYIASRPPGSIVTMDVNRNGQTRQLRVNLEERTTDTTSRFGLLGADLVPVTAETARQFGYTNLQSGLIVAGIEEGSSAARAELRVGDVIESAGGVPLKSVEQFSQLVDNVKRRGQPIRCVIRRGNGQFLLIIR